MTNVETTKVLQYQNCNRVHNTWKCFSILFMLNNIQPILVMIYSNKL
jgi:hypothetical protein